MLTVTDNNMNASTCPATVIVEDVTAPTCMTQNITVQLDAMGMASIVPADVNNGSLDVCGITTMALDIMDFDCASIASSPITVMLTVTDGNMNSSTCPAIVTVEDVTGPICMTQDITVQLDAMGVASIMMTDIDNGTTDACTGLATLVSVTPNTFTCTDIGTPVTVTLIAEDAQVVPNQSMCTAMVTVVDVIAPICQTTAITVDLDAMGSVTIAAGDIDDNSSDECSIMLSVSPSTFDCTNIGVNTVTMTVEDGSGNMATCTETVTVRDVTAPMCATNSPISVALDVTGNASIIATDIDAGSTDECGGMVSLAIDINAFTCADVGMTNTVTLTVTDVAGNSSTCTSIVNVTDGNLVNYNPAPFVNDTVIVNITTGDCTEIVNWQEPDPNAFDGVCMSNPAFAVDTIIRAFISGVDSDVFDGLPPVNGQLITAQFPIDTTIFSYTFQGATAADVFVREFVVIVTDTTAPRAICPTVGTLTLSANTTDCETELPDFSQLSIDANCMDVTVMQVPPAGTTYMNSTTDSVTIFVTSVVDPTKVDSCKFEVRIDHANLVLDSLSLHTPSSQCETILLIAPTAKNNCNDTIYAIPGTPINVTSIATGPIANSFIFSGVPGTTGIINWLFFGCLLYTSPSPRDRG